MSYFKAISWIFVILFIFTLGCANDSSEEGTGTQEVVEPADETGIVETEQGPELCGGIENLLCAEGQFCDLPAGQCKTEQAQGTCLFQPQVCTKDYRPVCGCDGRTYGNDCGRISAGVSKDYDGECKESAGY
ncbi:MAG: Kazal-type serine protease inhibitor family protein [Thermodesulfobacteriota bacterium]